jgi:poly(A) polymerase
VISPELLAIVQPLAARFRAAGFQLFLVGGIVRDEQLTAGSWSDIDLATDARPEHTKRLVAPLASAVWNQGERFGTIGCRIDGSQFEITTFRGDAYDPASRKPVVAFSDTIDRDLARRDFTINAMAVDAVTGELHDPYGGRHDLAARVLRTPLGADASFSDDPLRMLRAARFLARFDLAVVPDIVEAIERQRERLSIVSAERVRDELHKLFAGRDPSRGLTFLVQHQLLARWLPELAALGAVHDPAHGGTDVLTHTFAVIDALAPDPLMRMTALLHDLAKVQGLDDHAARGATLAVERLRGLRHAEHDVRDANRVIGMHHRIHAHAGAWSAGDVRRVVADSGDTLEHLVALSRANAIARGPATAAPCVAQVEAFERARVALGEEPADLEPELDGRQIMDALALGPGPAVGEASAFLRELRLREGALGEARVTEVLRTWWRTRHTGESRPD